jgi:hypothetical protein
MRKRVYISGPITKPDPKFGRNWNLFQANAAQAALMEAGFSCYNPMLSIAQQDELDWGTWLECDECWIAVSDLVLRLPGASLGAERECNFARASRIPVVGPCYFECLRELFPDEKKICRNCDYANLMRYHRAERRAAGLPAMSEAEADILLPAILLPAVVEGFDELARR